ncbi:hypothetical protein LRS71_08085 [Rhodococcus pyridinivorans]|uniref:hypothetical protein n=1 Tax=Rhodococcus pyridinivorans TaxID=103816 RepID=UPI001E52C1BE|nr:hypothetical protein [Rhodococcus pyridinivorans]MCD5419520.1 hypothetical protein [Rhodococcus pyridinivorans]
MQRMIDVGKTIQATGLPLLSSLLPLTFTANELGARTTRPPFDPGSAWPDHLAWGLDSVAAAVRLILSLQPIGASVIARTQLERWSSNLEFNSDIPQAPGEETVVWLNRIWEASGGLPNHLTTQVGDIFGLLSELMHARGPLMSLVWLDIADIAEPPTSEHLILIEDISDALVVSLTRIQACLATAAAEKGWGVLASTTAKLPLVSPAQGWLPDLRSLIWPLRPSFFQMPAVKSQLGALATGHLRTLSALQASKTPKEPIEMWPALSFGDHRFRARAVASVAYENERMQLGDRSRKDGIEELSTEAVLAGEMAAILAIWLREDPERSFAADAFAVCASGLRSAEWLWLEDDPRAMGCLRCVVEQLARARTWRLKPERANKIEQSPNSTPRDWIEGAGWRRLNLLNRALGEFAHGSAGVRWHLALDALVALQKDAENDDIAKYTGRTHALRVTIFLLAVECAAWTDTLSSNLGAAYRKVIRTTEANADRAIEDLLNHAWEKRGTPLR